jgi:hypothetical protein
MVVTWPLATVSTTPHDSGTHLGIDANGDVVCWS